jgi:hypothetical protein
MKVAPEGTVTEMDVSVADITLALTAPKYTCKASLVLERKFRPLIVTVDPTCPDIG